MNYIEELNIGDCFQYQDNNFILTSDFKRDGSKSSVCLKSGFHKWFKSNDVVNKIEIYVLDSDNNVIPIKSNDKNNNVYQGVDMAYPPRTS